MVKSFDNLVTCLVLTTLLHFVVGVLCLVAGFLRLDRKTPLTFTHAGVSGYERTSYDSDISAVFCLAAINLLPVIWPAACLADRWSTRNSGNSASRNQVQKNSVWSLYSTTYVTTKCNPFRWFEFTFSVPLSVLVCAIALGANDFMFLLSQMVLSVSVVVVAYGQEREKLNKKSDTAGIVKFAWFPLSSAVGLFTCQWALIFWTAHEAREFAQDTNRWGGGPVACFFAGSAATAYIMGRTSDYIMSNKGKQWAITEFLFKPEISPETAEISAQCVSCLCRVFLTFTYVPLFSPSILDR